MLCDTIGGKLDYLNLNGDYISPSEQFGVIVWVLAWLGEHKEIPKVIPVRRLLGPKEPPPEDIEQGEVYTSDLLAACQAVNNIRLAFHFQIECKTNSNALRPALSLLGLFWGNLALDRTRFYRRYSKFYQRCSGRKLYLKLFPFVPHLSTP